MYLDVTSTDKEILENVRTILNLNVKLGVKRTGRGTCAYRIQFKRVLLHKWFRSIGLTPNKSKTIGALNVPDEYFFDFLRGVWDGDGSMYAFWDKRWKSSYMFYITFVSASPPFLVWIGETVERLSGITGRITPSTRSFQLRYAKGGGKKLFEYMFHADQNTMPHLSRKFAKAQKIFRIDAENSKKNST